MRTKNNFQLEHSSDEECISLIHEIAMRMKNPSQIIEQICKPSNQNPSTDQSPWGALSLSHGYPGILLFFATLDDCYPNERWDEMSHQYVLKIKEAIEAEGVSDPSLFGGLAGICVAIDRASKRKTRYLRLLTTLNQHLIKQINAFLFPTLREKIRLGLPARMEFYDLISGISGIGAYLITQTDSAEAFDCLKELLSLAIGLTRDIQIGSHCIPGWYVPSHYQFLEKDRLEYPKGNFNLGMAHGVTGMLALLSTAQIQGISIQGQKEAIEKISAWIIAKKQVDAEHIYWPTRVNFEEEMDEKSSSSQQAPAAWCYGSAGIARCLYLAAKALNDKAVKDLSVSAFQSVFTRAPGSWILRAPSFCHGNAGVLTLATMMAHDTGSDELKGWIPKIRQQILSAYHPDFHFGFKDLEPIFKENFTLNQDEPFKMVQVEKAGLLDGVSGILLSLLSSVDYQTSWTLPFMLGG
ncbi:MAG: Nisin biosynthesis protein NisC [Chlamydiae bacterium]|nr:Nisin biosynthesis protein NisC [Chlamydiota bacterium]